MQNIIEIESKLVNRLKVLSLWFSVIIFLGGLIVIIGWIFDIPVLKSVHPSLVSMKANTALCFLLIGLSLLLQQKKYPESSIPNNKIRIAQSFAIIILLIGFLTLIQYIFNLNFGIDQILFKESVDAVATSNPGRMAPNTALNFFLMGLSLLLLDVETHQGYRPAQLLILIVGVISFLAFVGYLYGVNILFGFANVTSMALHTMVLFDLIFLAFLFIRPVNGFMKLVTSGSLGGMVFRWTISIYIPFLLFLGWFRDHGEYLGWYGVVSGSVIFTFIRIVIFIILIWIISKILHRLDNEHKKIEEELKKGTTQLESANKELEAFSYSVSHDLRAPLRHTSGYVELLIKRCKSDLSEKGQHYLESIADSVHQMGTLIDDLLQFSRTGRREMCQLSSDIKAIVQEALESLKKDYEHRTIEWIIGELPSVYCDYAMLKLVWVNLISNAVKFTRTREKAIIEIGVHQSENEYIFFIRDNGVGFDMKYAQKLFGVFQRLHSTEEFEGTGIGLANVQRIIIRHGGRTWAESELDKGATFYFTINK